MRRGRDAGGVSRDAGEAVGGIGGVIGAPVFERTDEWTVRRRRRRLERRAHLRDTDPVGGPPCPAAGAWRRPRTGARPPSRERGPGAASRRRHRAEIPWRS